MKKGKFMILGMLALGLVFAGCNTDSGGKTYEGSKTIKITGYNSQGGITVSEITIWPESAGAENWPTPPTACGNPVINGQTITYTLVNWDDHWGNPTSWIGTGKFFIVIECHPPKDSSKDGAKYVYSADGTNATAVYIKDEVTTLQWSKFIWLNDYMGG